ncbi:MAG: hypothetical protein MK098_08415 [Marinovum sp.]|nr:hypothetical protein [Marinovum sp.]
MKQVMGLAIALALIGGAIGLWLGTRPPLDESSVILRYAKLYAQEHSGMEKDCHAVPGRRDGVWLIVLCEGREGRFAYPVNRRGRLIEVTGDEA